MIWSCHAALFCYIKKGTPKDAYVDIFLNNEYIRIIRRAPKIGNSVSRQKLRGDFLLLCS